MEAFFGDVVGRVGYVVSVCVCAFGGATYMSTRTSFEETKKRLNCSFFVLFKNVSAAATATLESRARYGVVWYGGEVVVGVTGVLYVLLIVVHTSPRRATFLCVSGKREKEGRKREGE